MSENHSVETGVPPKRCFGGHGATPRPDSEYAECKLDSLKIIHLHLAFIVYFRVV